MRIAIFSAFTNSETINTIKEIITISEKLNHEIIIIESLKKDLESIKHNCKFFKKMKFLIPI